jgi:hypothetical protein
VAAAGAYYALPPLRSGCPGPGTRALKTDVDADDQEAEDEEIKEVRRMKPEQLVCPYCHESVQDVGIVKVETGLTQFLSFYYHPHAQRFIMFDDRTEQVHGAATRWQCRACRRELPGEITEYVNQHTAW